jgi:hypothetical protein
MDIISLQQQNFCVSVPFPASTNQIPNAIERASGRKKRKINQICLAS